MAYNNARPRLKEKSLLNSFWSILPEKESYQGLAGSPLINFKINRRMKCLI